MLRKALRRVVPALGAFQGRRQAFQDIKRQLTAEELANPGTQKVVLDLLITTEAERDELKAYVPKYYAADKRAEVLEEKNKSNKTNEIMFGVGVGVGCAIIGLAPFFYDIDPKKGPVYALIAVGVGFLLTMGATIGRIVFK